jgi:hypothetical protein
MTVKYILIGYYNVEIDIGILFSRKTLLTVHTLGIIR